MSELPPKAQLLKDWHERKGNNSWTLEEIAEIIADSLQLGEETSEERIIKLLEDAQITTVEIPDPVTFEPKEIKVRCEAVRADLLIALIKGETVD